MISLSRSTEALNWLSHSVGFSVTAPSLDENFKNLRSDFYSLKRHKVIIFGAGSGGQRISKILSSRGIEIKYYIDNFAIGKVDGLPVYRVDDAPIERNDVIILASIWFVDIAHQLSRKSDALSHCQLLVFPDPSILATDAHDDMVGYPFYETFLKRFDDFRKVADIWEGKSKDTYLRILAYRISFFRPISIKPNQLPCPSSLYSTTARPVPNIPATMKQQLSQATREIFAHPHYLIPEFMGPQRGDTVLDCGAWEGDTTYWFAKQVGPEGKVIAFEPSPLNCARFMEQWPQEDEAGDVTLVQKAVDERSGVAGWVELPEASINSRMDDANATHEVQVTSIDDYCRETELSPDFIKTDLEGSDFGALKGAANVIDRHRPDLAISMYHYADDLVEIPLWIHRHFPDYSFQVSHNNVGITESICMATTRQLKQLPDKTII